MYFGYRLVNRGLTIFKPLDALVYMTLRKGIMTLNAQIDWCDAYLNKLQTK
ncbi:hypothetical protein [Catenovulum sediminis]|uniref:Transcription regulator PadR C-terminal domain-containing protein n=1 Tax=Catenovulum sediminis TaxID=1740262 RepID=A0ABV1RM87_9ALTE